MQLIRTALFIVPASIGTQEATFLVLGGIIAGSAEPAIAAAVLVRLREIIWIIAGLVAGFIVMGSGFRRVRKAALDASE